MKLSKTKVTALALAVGAFAFPASEALAAVDTGYNANDMLLFFRNPGGATGTDQVVVFSLGSTWDVFRDAANPIDPTFGTTISLGNINTQLNTTYGTDWTSLSSSIFAGAVGQNGSTNGAATTTSNGDYARTVYVTKQRTSAGGAGSANSTGVTLPGTTAGQGNLANNISTSNNGAVSAGQPGVLGNTGTTIDDQNPFSSGNPATAYGFLQGGVMGALNSTTYSLGGVNDIVIGLDLYRATPVTNAQGWQNTQNISGVTAGEGYYLGTITLSSNGDVNFIAVPEPSTAVMMGLGFTAMLFGRRRRALNS
jgi:hypothetical protein